MNGNSEGAEVVSSGNESPVAGRFNQDKNLNGSTRRASRTSQDAPPILSPIQTRMEDARTNKANLPPLATTPRTPPSTTLVTPVAIVTPPTPVDQGDGKSLPNIKPKIVAPTTSLANPNITTSASGNMISHRRVRSAEANSHGSHQASKLSSTMSAPLTPTIEEGSAPGSRAGSGNQSTPSGFFSSVFSAAQNAANTLTNTLNNNQQPRSRSGTGNADADESKPADVTPITVVEEVRAPAAPPKQRAIDTIGTGDLSLSHLGISTDSPSLDSSNVTAQVDGNADTSGAAVRKDEESARAEDISAARAVSAAYGEKSSGTPVVEDVTPIPKTRSMYESSINGEKTPPGGSVFESEGTLGRTASIRSRVGKVTRRHRNSSSATGTTIGAAIGARDAALSNPALNGSSHKLTGFAVASKKRNRDFHQQFRSVPEDDYLIEDYSCALQKEIIVAGRIYVSEGHICFSSNILGWVTLLVISFDEVVSIEKEMTALIIPNAIAVQTLQARSTFRSLLSREATYDLLVGIWKLSHPNLSHSLNGARVADGTGDKTEKAEPTASDDASDDSPAEEDVYDEDDDEDEEGAEEEEGESFVETVENRSIAGSEPPPDLQTKSAMRKASAMGVAAGQAAGGVPTQSDAKNAEKAGIAAAASADFPGPSTHAPTECGDSAAHYDKVLKDEIIPAPLGKVYSMVFGPASGGFMSKWLLDDVKVTDLQMEDDKKGLSLEIPSRTYTYIKPLGGAIGPKSTKCIVTETLDAFDLEKSVTVTASTQTPDVPSGNIFTVKTKFCLSWAPGNATRFFMNCTIEWAGKSWLKSTLLFQYTLVMITLNVCFLGPIEKGANEGQLTYGNDLVKALRAGVSSRPRAGTTTSKGKKGGKRRKGDLDTSPAATASTKAAAAPQPSNWGPFEPIHGLLSPILDIFKPLFTAYSLIALLLFLLVISWFRNSRLRNQAPSTSNSGDRSSPYSYPHFSTPQRIAAYEEIWREEESALWDWLEERVGMDDGFAYPNVAKARGGGGDGSQQARRDRRDVLRGKGESVKGMARKEVEWAIGITEERLKALKDVVGMSNGRESDADPETKTETERMEGVLGGGQGVPDNEREGE